MATPHVESLNALNMLLDDLGEKYRNNWSNFDGRVLRSELNDITNLSARAIAGENVLEDIYSLRNMWFD